ncbi:hypothetical protein CGLO_17201 [Colletotrichum gloeosporioides Cg-14]|uniref:Uncharacterized protein n=1 Tax=Colletotrichum gloeosporioides (strain Cg-14) TaxID=1237896 RepID=T0KXC6_COLGC|nr:hypothetical protein CGLO_17201 [Colletotrichum gloeosporioides Cg-14]
MASFPRTHGPPELVQRSNVTSATGTSNPGCHATAVHLVIASLVSHLGPQPVHPTVLGLLGYSDSRNKLSPKNDVANSTDIPIRSQTPSMSAGSQPSSVLAHIAVWFAGIRHTITLPLASAVSSRDVLQLY